MKEKEKKKDRKEKERLENNINKMCKKRKR